MAYGPVNMGGEGIWTYTVTVPLSGWTGSSSPYTNTVGVKGITENTSFVSMALESSQVDSSDAVAAMRCWEYLDTQQDKIVFYSSTKPTCDFTVILGRK